MALVELTTCWNSFEAEIIKGVLDSAGRPCMFKGSRFSGIEIGSGGIGNSACSIPIFVQEEDYDAACSLLEEQGEGDDEETMNP